MSRIGRLPISIPAGVTVTVADGTVHVKGPKGQLAQDVVARTSVEVEGAEVLVSRADDTRQSRSAHGLMRSLTDNMVTGVSTGFSKRLEVLGIGYRADVRGTHLVLNLGYSHPIEYLIPDEITIEVDKDNKILVSGIDKQKVGQVAANIRDFRTPDRYKGKGVRYQGERILLKAGKSA